MRGISIPFFLIVATLMSYTAWKAAQVWPQHRIVAMLLVLPLFAFILGWQFWYRADPQAIQSPWFPYFAWGGSALMGLWATFILLSIPADVIHFGYWMWERWGREPASDPERREFFAQSFRLGILGAATGIAAVGFRQAVQGPKVEEVPVKIDSLPPALQGLKIAQISDLHVGPTIQKGYVENVVQRTNALEPDLIFITGDIADARAQLIREHFDPLGKLRAKYGVFYVTGNHEYYWDPAGLLEAIRSFGFTPLINQSHTLEIEGARVQICGIPDPVGGGFLKGHHPDLPQAVSSDVSPDLRILLAHRPEACMEAEPLGVHLQFSGHTHSGQFFPFSLLMPLAHRYYRGLNRHGKMWVYVNRGTGYWGPPNRFAIGSEITLARLA